MTKKSVPNAVFAKRLRQLLKETKTSHQKLAENIGVTQQSVSLWGSGQTFPDMYKFKKIAEYFGVSYDYLYGDTKSKSHQNMLICEELGLSDEAVENLKELNDSDDLSEIMSELLENIEFLRFLTDIRDLRSINASGTALERIDAGYAFYLALKQIERVLHTLTEEKVKPHNFKPKIKKPPPEEKGKV